jgi:hypothetical protein
MSSGTVKPLPVDEPEMGDRLRQLVNSYQITQAVHVAVTLRLPDLLAEGPRTADDVAVEAHADRRSRSAPASARSARHRCRAAAPRTSHLHAHQVGAAPS